MLARRGSVAGRRGSIDDEWIRAGTYTPTVRLARTQIVPSKVAPPVGDPTTVGRPRLTRHLDGDTRCVLVSAMSGFGKSTLVAEWAGERDDVAWVGVDGLDSDPSVFWAHVLAAVGQVDEEVGAEATELLAERGAADRMFVVALLSSLEHRATPITIVLDGLDGHLLREDVDSLGLLVERSDGGLRLVITTQFDPPLPLGRWRSRGLITEIREDELRLTADETAQLADRHGAAVDQDELADLGASLDGWPLALSLALSSGWRPSADPSTSVADISVVAQLTAHILAGMDDDERSVVLAAALLEQPEPEIMMRIVEPELAPALRRLTSRHPLVAVADPRRGAMQFRPTVRRLLEAELEWTDPIRRHELHRRAARVRQEQGDLRAAYRHLVVIGERDRAADLLLDPAYDTVGRGDLRAVRRLAGQLPAPGAVDDLDLALELGLIAAWGDSTVAARRWSTRAAELTGREADELERKEGERAVRRLDCMIATLDGDVGPALRLADERPPGVDRHRRRMDLHVDFVTARALLAMRHPRMHEWVQRVDVGATVPVVDHATVPTLRSWLHWVTGSLRVATESSEAAIRWIDDHAVDAHHWTFDSFITAGWCRLGIGDVDGATDLAERATLVAERIPATWNQLQSAYLLGRCRLSAGRPAEALAVVDEARSSVPFDRIRPYSDRLLHLAGEAEIAVGRVDRAAAIADQMSPGAFRQLIRARIEPLSDARLESTLGDRGTWSMSARIQAEVLLAVRGEHGGPSASLVSTIDEAAAEGWVQPFLGLGPRADRLLMTLPLDDIHPGLAAALSRSDPHREEHRSTGAELSSREVSLLELLPTHLSYSEMGERLYVSVNTVKSNLKTLYRKLGVHTRADAVEAARASGLI